MCELNNRRKWRWCRCVLFAAIMLRMEGMLMADIELSCDAFAMSLNDRAGVASLTTKPGELELIERVGSGFELDLGGRSLPCESATYAGDVLALRWLVDGVPIGADIRFHNRKSYGTFEIVRLVDIPRDATFAFDLQTAKEGARLQELDYMMDLRRDGNRGGRVERGHMWEQSADNPLGAFALYVFDSPREADERLCEIWANEVSLPHPAVEGAWTAEVAQRWVDRWIRELDLDGNTAVLAADTYSEAELYELADFAEQSGFRYLHMWCGMWRGEYWLSGERLNSTLNPELFPQGAPDLARFNEYLEERDMGMKWHTLAGCIAEQSPDFAGRNPKGLLASWGSGKLAGDIDAAETTLLLRMDPGFEPPRNVRGGYGPPVYPHWMRVNTLWLGGEFVTFDSLERGEEADLWIARKCSRGAYDSSADGHAGGTAAVGVLRTYGQDFVPDVNGPLVGVMAARLAEVMNAGRVRQIVFDGFEDLSSEGTWGRFKYAAAVYSHLRHPTMTASSGTFPPCWLEYRFNAVGSVLRWNGRIRTVIDHTSRPAIGPDELQFALSRHVAHGAVDFDVTGYDVKGIPFAELKQLGILPDMIEQMQRWGAVSRQLTDDERSMIGGGRGSATYRGGADPFYALRGGADDWRVVPVHVLRRPDVDVGWQEIGEIGLNGPWQYVQPGDMLTMENPYREQPLSFILRVWPEYDRNGTNNVDLIARSAPRGKRVDADAAAAFQDTVDTMGLMAAIEPREKLDLQRRNGVLLLSAANASDRPREIGRADTRIGFRGALNLSEHRGLGMTLVGDGSGALLVVSLGRPRARHYVVPIDFTGRRYVEIPSPQKFWSDAAWGKPDKWTRFSAVPEAEIKFGRIPPKTEALVAIESLQALRELDALLVDPVITVNARSLHISGRVPSGHYLKYDGGLTATVYDPNWHKIEDLPVKGKDFAILHGPAKLQVSATGESKPWLQVRFKVEGDPIASKAAGRALRP